MALVLAIVTTTVVTVMVVAMLSFTSSSSRDASVKDSRQTAYALAEAGVNQALAQLASHFYRDNSPKDPSPYQAPPDDDQPINGSTVFDPDWFANTTNSQKSSTDGSPCTQDGDGIPTSTCMAWTVSRLADPPAGITRAVLRIAGTGTVLNPTGAAPLVQTAIVRVKVLKVPKLVKTPDYWKKIYTGAPPAFGTCNLTLGQGVHITAPLYVAGNLCLEQSAQLSGSNVTLDVFGWVWLKNTSTVGSSGGSPARIQSARISGACSTSSGNKSPDQTGEPHCTVNVGGGKVWDSGTPLNNPGHSAASPVAEALPTVDFAEAQSEQADPTAPPTCNNGRSLTTEPDFALTPIGAAYHCITAVGEIDWNGSSLLTVDGNIYFPNNLYINSNNNLVTYTGIGSFFVRGAITAGGGGGGNNSYLCVKLAGGDCDFANATDTGSSGYWDATKALLLLQAQGAVSGQNFHFQGGVYSATSITFGGGQGNTQGPLVSPNTIIVGQQLNGSFPSFPEIQSGSLGTLTPLTLGAPYGGG